MGTTFSNHYTNSSGAPSIGTLDSIRDQVISRTPIREWAIRAGFRSGGRMLKCRDHDDASPSVSIRGHRLHCFSCNRWWDAIDLAMDLWGCTFVEALKRLAAEHGIPWQSLSPAERERYRRAAAAAPELAQDIADWVQGVTIWAEERKAELVQRLDWAAENDCPEMAEHFGRQIELLRPALSIRADGPRVMANAYTAMKKSAPARLERFRQLGRKDREFSEALTGVVVSIIEEAAAA